ncbi:hypothetical protein HBB04_03930 [Pseudomonas coronafaciens]|nr:hypothetical protein HBB04_03930 [Pseudomonas coronafaciens]
MGFMQRLTRRPALYQVNLWCGEAFVSPDCFIRQPKKYKGISFFSVALNLLYPFVVSVFFAGVHDLSIVDNVLEITDVQIVPAAEGLVIMVHQGHYGFCVILDLLFEFSELINRACEDRFIIFSQAIVVINYLY